MLRPVQYCSRQDTEGKRTVFHIDLRVVTSLWNYDLTRRTTDRLYYLWLLLTVLPFVILLALYKPTIANKYISIL